jgi:hypothetical protein
MYNVREGGPLTKSSIVVTRSVIDMILRTDRSRQVPTLSLSLLDDVDFGLSGSRQQIMIPESFVVCGLETTSRI